MTRGAAALLALAACGGRSGSTPTSPAPAKAAPCLADRVPDPMPAQRNPSECRGGAEAACRAACSAGDAAACVGVAYLFEGTDRSRAFSFYERGCVLGSAIACTNYGAYLLGEASDASSACAVRLHRMACDAGDPWGCGMLGVELARGVGIAKDLAEAERVLGAACDRYGSFACTVLAGLTAQGEVGDDPAAAVELYRRACDTGDDNACDGDLAPAP